MASFREVVVRVRFCWYMNEVHGAYNAKLSRTVFHQHHQLVSRQCRRLHRQKSSTKECFGALTVSRRRKAPPHWSSVGEL